jgi:hypothetical protein
VAGDPTTIRTNGTLGSYSATTQQVGPLQVQVDVSCTTVGGDGAPFIGATTGGGTITLNYQVMILGQLYESPWAGGLPPYGTNTFVFTNTEYFINTPTALHSFTNSFTTTVSVPNDYQVWAAFAGGVTWPTANYNWGFFTQGVSGGSLTQTIGPVASVYIDEGPLWSQTEVSGSAFVEDIENSPYDAYDAEGADDFVVTWSHGWNVERVGVYASVDNPAGLMGMHVTVYDNDGGRPGSAVCSFPGSSYSQTGSNYFVTDLPTPCALMQNTYWLSVQPQVDYSVGGTSYWHTTWSQIGNPGQWRNPGGAWGQCPTWAPVQECLSSGPDFAFRIFGSLSSCSALFGYGDGLSDGIMFFGGYQAGNPDRMMGVLFDVDDSCFTPGGGEITAIQVGNQIASGGPWPNEVFIYPDQRGVPNDSVILAQGTVVTGDGTGDVTIELPEPLRVGGDFWLMVRGYPEHSGESFNVEFDSSGAVGRSFYSSSGISGLTPSSGVNWVLRVVMVPSDELFVDGFESGNTSAWFATSP